LLFCGATGATCGRAADAAALNETSRRHRFWIGTAEHIDRRVHGVPVNVAKANTAFRIAFSNTASAFEGEPELHERSIPLQRDELQRMARLFELRALEFPKVFASHHDVAHQARRSQYTQMFADGLARNVGSGRQLCDRHGAFGAQNSYQAQSRRIAKSCEHYRGLLKSGVNRMASLPRHPV
jgi:hypothetical protein